MSVLPQAMRDLETRPHLMVKDAPDEIANWLRPLLVGFQDELGYTGAIIGEDLGALVDGMHRMAAEIGMENRQSSHERSAFQAAANYAHLCYPKHPLDIRIYAGIFTWIGILIDDDVTENTEDWTQFMSCFHDNRKQPTIRAQAWSDVLRLSYKHYSPMVANFIVTSALNFVNARVLERTEVPKMTCTAGGQAWPYYFRDKNGVAEAYVWFSFPDIICSDVASYIEAIPDMNKFICLTNDILSFYKEECAGDDDNYIRSRARYESSDISTVFKAVIRDCVDAFKCIRIVLQGKGPAAEAWLNHAMGFVAFHKVSARYNLAKLGLGEYLTKKA
ncbi:isoprenoid synthase domain-containing protein [Xylariaceae sp. FL1272]|nr:isoprenoid synthase domain-containing protein [Xylariaceae sp. FL1272]